MDFLEGFRIGASEKEILFNMLMALIAGFIIMYGYVFAQKKQSCSKNFAITIFLLPIIMTVVMPFIATDLKKAVSLAGIFALVRFRSIPGDSKDILYVFFALAVGVVLGLSNYVEAFVLTFIITFLFVLLQKKWPENKNQILRITIPEDMNYKDSFNDIFDKYLKRHSIREVKTTNMGALFTISYDILFKGNADVKAFMDEVRTRNGNLTVAINDYDAISVL